MVQVVFNIIFLLILASIVILNVGNTTNINLFFDKFENVSVVVIVFLSFILGVLYAFCYTLFWKIRKKFGSKKSGENEGKKNRKDDAVPLQDEPPVPPFS